MANNETVVPCFETVDDLREALSAKDNFEPIDLYPRDGTRLLSEVEAHVAELVGVKSDELVLCNSGMSAVIGAIETCVRPGAVLACGEELYSQTTRYIQEHLRSNEVKIVQFDTGSADDIDRVLDRHQPDVVVAETVGNGPNVPVLDVTKLLQHPHIALTKPFVILDNTLPLSTAQPLGEQLTTDDPIIVVESGTKSYAFNQEVFGHIYTKNPALLRAVRERRRTKGFGTNVATIERIADLLPPDRNTFDTYNEAVFRTTGQLALACADGIDDSDGLFINHPVLPHHSAHKTIDDTFPHGTSPVFFLQSYGKEDQFALTRRLWENPDVREQCELGQSFAFGKTRILLDAHAPIVRIAGGAYTDTQILGDAFRNALSK